MKYIALVISTLIILSNINGYALPEEKILIDISILPDMVSYRDPDPYLFVSLEDSYGNPIPALDDITINLLSTNTTVADLPEKIIIPKGKFYAKQIIEKHKEGRAEIKASYMDQSVSSSIQVIGEEGTIALSAKLPSENMLTGTSMPISIFLADADGNIARAPFDITIDTEYAQDLIKVELPSKIGANTEYITGNISSLHRAGNAWIKIRAEEIDQEAIVMVNVTSNKPSSLTIKALPGNITIFDHSFYIYAGLLDENGEVAQADRDLIVRLFTNMTNIINSSINDILIKKGEYGSFINVPLSPFNTGSSYVISITASADGLKPASTLLNITNEVLKYSEGSDKRLSIESIPLAGEGSKVVAVIQVKNSNGSLYLPAGIPDPVVVSSNPDALHAIDIGSFNRLSSFSPVLLETGSRSDDVILTAGIAGVGSANTTLKIITREPESASIFTPLNTLRDMDLYLVLKDREGRVVNADQEAEFLIKPINSIISIKRGHSYAYHNFLLKDSISLEAIPVGINYLIGSNLTLNRSDEPDIELRFISALKNISNDYTLAVQLLKEGKPFIPPFPLRVTFSSLIDDTMIHNSSYALVKPNSVISDTVSITAKAEEATSILSLYSHAPLLPLYLEDEVENGKFILRIKSLPGAKLEWSIPEGIKAEAENLVSSEGSAEAIIYADRDATIKVHGSKTGYLANEIVYNIITPKGMNMRLIKYTDTVIPKEAADIEAVILDTEGKAVDNALVKWSVSGAKVLQASNRSDTNGKAYLTIMRDLDDTEPLRVSATAQKGMLVTDQSIDISVEGVNEVNIASADTYNEAELASYITLALVGGAATLIILRRSKA